MVKLGTVKRHGFNAEGHERRERLEAICECNKCGADVELWADTEEWTRMKDGRWRHAFYGGAMGMCCDTLYADCLSDGYRAFDLRDAKAGG